MVINHISILDSLFNHSMKWKIIEASLKEIIKIIFRKLVLNILYWAAVSSQ